MAFPMIISEKIYSFSTLPLPTGSLRMRSYLTAPCWSFCGKVLVVPMTKSCTTGVVWKKQPAVKLWNPPFHGIHHKYLSWKHVWKRDFEFLFLLNGNLEFKTSAREDLQSFGWSHCNWRMPDATGGWQKGTWTSWEVTFTITLLWPQAGG